MNHRLEGAVTNGQKHRERRVTSLEEVIHVQPVKPHPVVTISRQRIYSGNTLK